MVIKIDKYGNITWHFYRKAYRKARWRRMGQRFIDNFTKHNHGFGALIILI